MYGGYPCENWDGDGIIIDDGNHSQPVGRPLSATVPAYKGTTRIYNNLVWGNGGVGILAYQSANVQIVSNTVWSNLSDTHNNDPQRAEIVAQDSANVGIWSNVAYADLGRSGTRYSIAIVNRQFFGAASYMDHIQCLEPEERPDACLAVESRAGQHGGGRSAQSLRRSPLGHQRSHQVEQRRHSGSPVSRAACTPRPICCRRIVPPSPRPGAPPSVTAGAYQQPDP